MKVLICDKIADEGIEILEEAGLQIKKAWDIPKDELPDIVADYDGMVVRSATKVKGELMENAEKLKVIGRAGIGLDNIDLQRAEERGIAVRNTPAATTVSVAELAFMHMMALTRDVVAGTNALREGKWIKKQLKSTEVMGKTLGIIGYGRIGGAFAERAVAFGMKVLANKRHPPEESPEGVTFVSLDELLENSDYISQHAPHNESTHHMISTEEFNKMKDGVYLIDCGRGGVVDLDALYQALKDGKVQGAALDVFPEEPPGKHKIFEFDNVHGTPHIGAQTAEGQIRAGEQVAEAIIEELNK